MDIEVDEKWTFRDLVQNARILKQQYDFCLAFFSSTNVYEEVKIRNIIIKHIKKQIYSLNMEEWKKDKVWEYMNGDVDYPLLSLLARIDKNDN